MTVKRTGNEEIEVTTNILNNGAQKENAPNSDDQVSKFPKITVEPIAAIAGMIVWMSQTSVQNLFLETACMVDSGHPRNECIYGMGDKSPHEVQSQKIEASVNVLRGFLESSLTACILLFFCPWSDFSGRRKPTILLPLVGMAISTFNALMIITFPRLAAIWVIYLIQFPLAATGNQLLLFIALFNYLGDICFATGRSMLSSMVFILAAHFVFIAIGTVIGPLIYRSTGFYGIFGISFTLEVLMIAYVWIYIRDVNANKNNRTNVLNINLPYSALKCIFKKRDGYKRCCILLMILNDAFDKLIYAGDLSLQYLFLRKKLAWSDILYGSFVCYKFLATFSGLIFILLVLKRRLKLEEFIIGICGGISQCIAIIILMLAPNDYVIFISPLVGILTHGTVIVLRPTINNQIKADEQGKISSVIGALNALSLVAISPLYSAIYKSTVDVFPAAYMCISLFAALMQVINFIIARKLISKENTIELNEKEMLNKNNETW